MTGRGPRPSTPSSGRHLHFPRSSLRLAAALVLIGSVLAACTHSSPQTGPGGTVLGGTGPTCQGRAATLVGTAGNDVIVGSSGNDVIVGLGGNDLILGGKGNDVICGGPGDDSLIGDPGNDTLSGGTGSDGLFGEYGEDTEDGGPGNDRMT